MTPTATVHSSPRPPSAARRAFGGAVLGLALAACGEQASGPTDVGPVFLVSDGDPVRVASVATIDAAQNVTAEFGTAFSSVDRVTACLMFQGDLWDPGELWFLIAANGGGGGQINTSPEGSPGSTLAELNGVQPPDYPPQPWPAEVADGTFDGYFAVENGSANANALVISVLGVPTQAVAPAGVLEVSPTLQFGDVEVGTSAVQSATIANSGDGDLTIAALAVYPWNYVYPVGYLPTQYSLVNPPATPLVLAPGESVELTIRFAAEVEGSAGGRLEILSDGTSCFGFLSFGAQGVRTLVEVDVDIKPGSAENPINTRSRGRIPVAILSNAEFDATTAVDRASLTFGATGDEPSLHLRGGGVPNCGVEDVNDDGYDDLVCHFDTQRAGFQVGDTEGVLRGQTTDGKALEGRDAVWILR